MMADLLYARTGQRLPQTADTLRTMRAEDQARSAAIPERVSLADVIDAALARMGVATPEPAPAIDTKAADERAARERKQADQRYADEQVGKLLSSLQGLEKPKVTNMQTGVPNGVTVPQRSQDTVGQVKAEIIRIATGCSVEFLRAQLEERGVAVPQNRVEKPSAASYWQIPSVDILRWAYTMAR
jgi:hypothetical protein